MKALSSRGFAPSVLVVGSLVGALVGCGGGGGGSRGGASIAPSTSSNTPRGTTPIGSGTTTRPGTTPIATATIAKSGPAITITAPVRGAFLTQQVAKVEGKVTDPVGVAMLTIQGNPVAFSATGAFAEVVPLTPGMNTIVVEAFNKGYRSSKASLSVVAGQFQPESQPIQDAMALRLNAQALDAIATAAASQLGGPMLAQQIMARNPLYKNSIAAFGLTIASAEVNCTAASFGQPSLKLTPIAGALVVHAEIPNVSLTVNAKDYGGIPFSITGTITASKASVDAQVVLTAQNGVLVSSVQNATCSLDNFKFGLNGFPAILTSLASSFVEKLIEDEVAKQVGTIVPQELNKALAGLAKPFTQTVLGSTISVLVAPSFVGQDALGMTLRTDANVLMAPIGGFQPLASPGSFVTKGPAPANLGSTPGFSASFNQDLMNRMGHAMWKSGLMELELSNGPTSTFPVPAYFKLDGAFIQTWIPELRGKFSASDPILMVLSPKLPPIFQAKAKPDTIEAGIGEFDLTIYNNAAGAGKQVIITIAMHLKLNAGAKLANNTVTLAVNPNVFIDASLVSCPLAPNLDGNGVSNFIQFTIPPILQIAANTWSGFALPVYPGLSPKNVDIDADGAQKTFVTVKGDL